MSRKAIGVSNRYFYSNEMMVDIRLVLVLCPRDIFLDKKNYKREHKKPDRDVIDLETGSREMDTKF